MTILIRANRSALALCVAVAALAVSGCVSTGTFEKMQADKNAEITGLQGEKTALQQEIDALTLQKAALSQQSGALQEQYTMLGIQKAELEAASKQRQSQYAALVNQLAAEVEKGDLKVRQYQNMLAVDIADQIFFDSGRATLKSSGIEILTKLGEALKGYNDKLIRVVGHTDNVPVAKVLQTTFPSNWELSVARATNVVRALQAAGVPPERLVASGRGEYSPLAANDTPEGRQKNRRIEIMLIDASLVEEMSKVKE
jgi:chemotaxis protein MotB